MTQDFSIVHLLLNASWVVQVVVLMLMTVSIVSWAAIFRKIGSIKRIKELNDEFERDFWSGTSLNELFAAAAQNAKTSGPWNVSSPVACASIKNCANAASTTAAL
jgi:biopolymer transport protein TolQ